MTSSKGVELFFLLQPRRFRNGDIVNYQPCMKLSSSLLSSGSQTIFVGALGCLDWFTLYYPALHLLGYALIHYCSLQYSAPLLGSQHFDINDKYRKRAKHITAKALSAFRFLFLRVSQSKEEGVLKY